MWGGGVENSWAVETLFHTETEINSPSEASRSTHEGAWLQRGGAP